MWRMLQHDSPRDYVIATGTSYSVRDFVSLAFDHVGLDWETYVDYDERYLRPDRGGRADRGRVQGQRTSWAGRRRCMCPSSSASWSTPTSPR